MLTLNDSFLPYIGISNMASQAVSVLIETPSTSLPNIMADFLIRVNGRLINKKVMESLTKTGAFDSFMDRGALLEKLDDIIAQVAKINKNIQSGQTDLFGNSSHASPTVKIDIGTSTSSLYDNRDYLQWERELLGLYLSSHPLEPFKIYLAEKTIPISSVSIENEGKIITIGGVISAIRQITTKNGQPMAFVTIEDYDGDTCELVVFPNTYKDTTVVWNREKVISATGRISGLDKEGRVNGDSKIIVDNAEIVTLETAKNYKSTGFKPKLGKRKSSIKINNKASLHPSNTVKKTKVRLYLHLNDTSDQNQLQLIKELLDNNVGNTAAVLVVGNKEKQIIKLPQQIDPNVMLITELKNLIGESRVKLS